MVNNKASQPQSPQAAHHTLYLIRGAGEHQKYISVYAIALNGGHSPTIEEIAQQMHDEYGYTFRRCDPLVRTGDVLWLPQALALEWAAGTDFIVYRQDSDVRGRA